MLMATVARIELRTCSDCSQQHISVIAQLPNGALPPALAGELDAGSSAVSVDRDDDLARLLLGEDDPVAVTVDVGWLAFAYGHGATAHGAETLVPLQLRDWNGATVGPVGPPVRRTLALPPDGLAAH